MFGAVGRLALLLQVAVRCGGASRMGALGQRQLLRHTISANELFGIHQVPPQENLSHVLWLHVPKTGTSFISTIWSYACGRGKVLDLNVSPNASRHCTSCYDFALMDKYPKEEYCGKGSLFKMFDTQHKPFERYYIDKFDVNYVGFFRRPSQRLISAYHNGMHAAGFTQETIEAMHTECEPEKERALACYVRYPGIAGCATRLLSGDQCAYDCRFHGVSQAHKCNDGTPPAPSMDEALDSLSKMKFVGITEEWDESVCLFHLMFGGRLYPEEFRNEHPGELTHNHHNNLAEYDEDGLEGFVDEADEIIYKAAVERFKELRSSYAGGDSACYALLKGAEPKSVPPGTDCKGLRAECGEVEGGGDCGSCPRLKVSFLEQDGDRVPTKKSKRPICASGTCYVDSVSHPNIFGW